MHYKRAGGSLGTNVVMDGNKIDEWGAMVHHISDSHLKDEAMKYMENQKNKSLYKKILEN
jgi:hypothetical protein